MQQALHHAAGVHPVDLHMPCGRKRLCALSGGVRANVTNFSSNPPRVVSDNRSERKHLSCETGFRSALHLHL